MAPLTRSVQLLRGDEKSALRGFWHFRHFGTTAPRAVLGRAALLAVMAPARERWTRAQAAHDHAGGLDYRNTVPLFARWRDRTRSSRLEDHL